MTIEAMKQALEALEWCYDVTEWPANGESPQDKAIESLRAAIEQAEKQEPVAWYYAGSDVEWHSIALDADLDDAQKANCTPLYTAPPQREWVGLTDEEIESTWQRNLFETYIRKGDVRTLGRAIEAKLWEKNT